LIGVAVLALVLLIPLDMVRSVVRERHHTYQGVVAEIAAAWSGDQRLAGPILVLPYTEKVEVRDEFITPQGEKKSTRRWESRERRAVVLPEELSIDGILTPQLRQRGIYRVQVYTAEVTVSGAFRGLRSAVDSLTSAERLERVDWSQAVVAFGLSDPRGIVEADALDVNGHVVRPRPGTTLECVVPHGFHVAVDGAISDEREFELPLVFRGSGSVSFLPLGETTRVSFRSTWTHPSFVGGLLPAERTIDERGFSAGWTIPLLSRSFPQVWQAGTSVAIDDVEGGVRLFEPVALYDAVTRAVKYGLLFIALTFLTLGLIEYVTDARLSLVQFLLIGVALAMFFLILIALAEHMGFATAYALASATVVVINTLYLSLIHI
jgi:inner membrane protein